MKWLMVLVSALALVAVVVLFPQAVIVACPVGLLATLAFVVEVRHEREDREERRHRELIEAAKRPRSG